MLTWLCNERSAAIFSLTFMLKCVHYFSVGKRDIIFVDVEQSRMCLKQKKVAQYVRIKMSLSITVLLNSKSPFMIL
jgi:hypothetical protein